VHVLILNQTFWPDVAATAQLMWDLARHLDRRGHRVTAVASRHFYGTDREIPAARERVGNIRIRRVRGTGFGKGSSLGTLGRLSDFASFYAAAAVELTRVDDPPPDVILALTSPPMIATLAALRPHAVRVPRDGPVPRRRDGRRPDVTVAPTRPRDGCVYRLHPP
jgi:colanic acid biosynthesis glycosyl transferase WcaI